jgi:ligand-binding SRPBCC domain-containing protein
MPKIYQLYREQVIATDLETAWDFMSSPKNLDAITPDDLSFEIITEVPEVMYNGLLIEYRVGIPLLGKQTWLTELKHIRNNHSFVDEQRIGPYKVWYHYHEITPHAEGVRFVDRVNYVLPCGPFGSIAHGLYVKRKLNHIFDHRAKVAPKLLNPKCGAR